MAAGPSFEHPIPFGRDQWSLEEINLTNSLRVSFFSNSPQKAEVVVTEFCFWTPLIIIQR